jgi:NAD(P)-dependent dehydrogenase (short-subunit alcohol dehydrogenase family)
MKLKNSTAIITGANQGFGYAVAERFVKEGASIIICARDISKLNDASEKLKKISSSGQKIICKQLDVSIEKDVKKFIDDAIDEFGKIDILVNNAGVYGPKGLLEDVDPNEWIKAIEINLFGVFYTCKYMIPYMKKNKFGKIINLSGGGATNPLPRISAYAASKAAVVRLTETLAEETKDSGLDINAIAPGALNTRLLEEVLEAGSEKVGKAFYEKAIKQKNDGGAPIERGTSLCVFLASQESNGITGKLISAIWDPWENIMKYKEELMNSDIYALRRIIPEDRNKKWE